MNLFSYGTLQAPEVWERVAGYRQTPQSAKLPGYAVWRIRSGIYPVLIEETGAEADGAVYRNLNETTVHRLDDFESDMYERRKVEATTADGEKVPCEAYVLQNRHRGLASDERWDLDWFRREALSEYFGTTRFD